MLSTALRAAAGSVLTVGLVTGFSAPAHPQAAAASMTPVVAAGQGACVFHPSAGQGVKNVGTPPATAPHTGTVGTTLKTNLGEIELALDAKNAPCTVNSFTHLAGKNFFDNTDCHRLTTGALKVLQCGDPTRTGSGGPGYRYEDENLPKAAPGKGTATYAAGTLAMANAGPGTNGSQFFLVYGDCELPPAYTVFGKITSGMGLLKEVAKAGTDDANGEGDGAPKKRVTIQDVAVGASPSAAAR